MSESKKTSDSLLPIGILSVVLIVIGLISALLLVVNLSKDSNKGDDVSVAAGDPAPSCTVGVWDGCATHGCGQYQTASQNADCSWTCHDDPGSCDPAYMPGGPLYGGNGSSDPAPVPTPTPTPTPGLCNPGQWANGCGLNGCGTGESSVCNQAGTAYECKPDPQTCGDQNVPTAQNPVPNDAVPQKQCDSRYHQITCGCDGAGSASICLENGTLQCQYRLDLCPLPEGVAPAEVPPEPKPIVTPTQNASSIDSNILRNTITNLKDHMIVADIQLETNGEPQAESKGHGVKLSTGAVVIKYITTLTNEFLESLSQLVIQTDSNGTAVTIDNHPLPGGLGDAAFSQVEIEYRNAANVLGNEGVVGGNVTQQRQPPSEPQFGVPSAGNISDSNVSTPKILKIDDKRKLDGSVVLTVDSIANAKYEIMLVKEEVDTTDSSVTTSKDDNSNKSVNSALAIVAGGFTTLGVALAGYYVWARKEELEGKGK